MVKNHWLEADGLKRLFEGRPMEEDKVIGERLHRRTTLKGTG
jgi:hypothetical protein